MKLIATAGLVCTAFVTYQTLAQTPAFSSKLRADTVEGSWRINEAASMYDTGAYNFQRGYGFLMADVVLPDIETAIGENNEQAELATARLTMARTALDDAIKSDPGNAHAWLAIAWTEARLGETNLARAALKTSWELAPNNLQLAESRIELAALIFDKLSDLGEPTAQETAAVRKDLSVLERFEPETIESYRELLAETSIALG